MLSSEHILDPCQTPAASPHPQWSRLNYFSKCPLQPNKFTGSTLVWPPHGWPVCISFTYFNIVVSHLQPHTMAQKFDVGKLCFFLSAAVTFLYQNSRLFRIPTWVKLPFFSGWDFMLVFYVLLQHARSVEQQHFFYRSTSEKEAYIHAYFVSQAASEIFTVEFVFQATRPQTQTVRVGTLCSKCTHPRCKSSSFLFGLKFSHRKTVSFTSRFVNRKWR